MMKLILKMMNMIGTKEIFEILRTSSNIVENGDNDEK